jgi:hypothetical protein
MSEHLVSSEVCGTDRWKTPNTACSRQVGLGAFFELFRGFGFILLSSVVRVPPTCG